MTPPGGSRDWKVSAEPARPDSRSKVDTRQRCPQVLEVLRGFCFPDRVENHGSKTLISGTVCIAATQGTVKNYQCEDHTHVWSINSSESKDVLTRAQYMRGGGAHYLPLGLIACLMLPRQEKQAFD